MRLLILVFEVLFCYLIRYCNISASDPTSCSRAWLEVVPNGRYDSEGNDETEDRTEVHPFYKIIYMFEFHSR